MTRDNRNKFQVNVASNGLTRNDGTTLGVSYIISYAQADADGVRVGDWVEVSKTIYGNSTDRIGQTTIIETGFTGPCLVKAKRTTPEYEDDPYSVITLEYLYSIEPMNVQNFGDVTTVQVRTTANERASAISDRKFNCLVTRKLPRLQSDGTLTEELLPTKRFFDYFVYATVEQHIGRRSMAELNTIELYNRAMEVYEYFGNKDSAIEFSYTFDSDQISFQDTLQYISNAAFCNATRQGGIFNVVPDLPSDPTTLFTHRSKVPFSQTITRSFKSDSENDGLNFNYIDPDSNEKRTLVFPEDRIPSKPEKYEVTGVRNHDQAWWHAWRRYNTILSRRLSVKDTLLQDAMLLRANDVILLSNDTLGMPQSGSVVNASGMLLQLSQPVNFDEGSDHSISLRMRDGSIDSIDCSRGPDAHHVILGRAPRESLYTGYNEEKTQFIFNRNDSDQAMKLIVSSVDINESYEVDVECFNYSDKIYERDGERSPYSK